MRRRGEGLQKKRFSVVLSTAPEVEITTMPEIPPSVSFRGILTMVVLLAPSFPPTINPH